MKITPHLHFVLPVMSVVWHPTLAEIWVNQTVLTDWTSFCGIQFSACRLVSYIPSHNSTFTTFYEVAMRCRSVLCNCIKSKSGFTFSPHFRDFGENQSSFLNTLVSALAPLSEGVETGVHWTWVCCTFQWGVWWTQSGSKHRLQLMMSSLKGKQNRVFLRRHVFSPKHIVFVIKAELITFLASRGQKNAKTI